MSTIRHIRKELLDVSQQRFAEIAGTSQASVSRWETGLDEPTLGELRRIADEVRARGMDFDERFFFEAIADAPKQPEAQA